MSEEQYSAIIANLVTNQSMLVAILKVLGVKEKEVMELDSFAEKTTEKYLKRIKEMEKKNGK